jgi:hypothetical protein
LGVAAQQVVAAYPEQLAQRRAVGRNARHTTQDKRLLPTQGNVVPRLADGAREAEIARNRSLRQRAGVQPRAREATLARVINHLHAQRVKTPPIRRAQGRGQQRVGRVVVIDPVGAVAQAQFEQLAPIEADVRRDPTPPLIAAHGVDIRVEDWVERRAVI